MSENNAPASPFADDFHGADDRSNILAGLARQNPRERVQAALDQINQKAVCPDCNSEWFFEVSLNQYAASAYSATPGGDLAVVSAQPHTIRICVCGRPFSPNLGGASVGGRMANESLVSMRASIQAALEKRDGGSKDSAEPEVAVGTMISSAVNTVIEQFGLPTITEQIEQLKSAVAEIQKSMKRGKGSAADV